MRCPGLAYRHTYTHTHTKSFTRGERVPQSQISHSSQLGGQDTGRVNLIREKIRPWQTERLLLWPWGACKFKTKFNRCHTVAAPYLVNNVLWGSTVCWERFANLCISLSHLRNETKSTWQPWVVCVKNRAVNPFLNWRKQRKHTSYKAFQDWAQISCKQVICEKTKPL